MNALANLSSTDAESEHAQSTVGDREVRLRPDLQWIEQVRAGESTWVARDPLTLQYFYFSNIEKRFLSLLDQHRSVGTALGILKSSTITRQWAEQLLHRLDSMGLLIKQGEFNRGQRLWQLTKQSSHGAIISSLLNPLSIRIKLLDPNKAIERLSGFSWLLFNRWTCAIVAMLVPVFAWLVLVRLSSSGFSFIQHSTILWNWQIGLQLMVAYALVKSLHELGHALACRYHGVRCHEIGVMFLLFVPCLYCDTSDSWRLSSRWRRAAIAAAGIYVELIVGMLAGLVWLLTHPESVTHLISACVVILATVSTLMVNANPLMRYDGYYVLSDLWGVPNLAHQGQSALRSKLASLFLGERGSNLNFDAPSWLLVGYALAAKVYQTFVLCIIVLAAWALMDQAGFRLGGVILVSTLIARLLFGYLTALRSLIRTGTTQPWFKTARATALAGLLAIVGSWICFFLELPTWVSSRGVSELDQLKPLFASETGVLVSCIDTRKPIAKGDSIAQLRSVKFEQELLQLDGDVQALMVLLEQLGLETIDDDRAAGKLAEVTERISKHHQRRAIVADQLAQMNIVAEQAGVFIPSQVQAPPVLTQASDRSAWRPILEQENLGCTIDRGTLLGWIAPANNHTVLAYVHQSDLELITLGMKARVRWDGFSDQISEGVVTKVMQEPLTQTPDALIGDESFVSQNSFDGKLRPNVPHYEVYIRLDEQPEWLLHQNVATVHIATQPRTIWRSIVRQFELNVRPTFFLQGQHAEYQNDK